MEWNVGLIDYICNINVSQHCQLEDCNPAHPTRDNRRNTGIRHRMLRDLSGSRLEDLRSRLHILPTAFTGTFIPGNHYDRYATSKNSNPPASSRRPGGQPTSWIHVRKLTLHIGRESLSQILLDTLADTLIRLTGVISCIWIQPNLPPSQCPTGETLRMRLYQFLRLPSLVKACKVVGADPVLIHFLASCE